MCCRLFTIHFAVRSGFIAVLLLPMLVGCKQNTETRSLLQLEEANQQKRLQLYNQIVYPGAVNRIENGDIIFRLGSDITSEMFRQMNQTDQRYSHVGVASIEKDSVFVYHAIGGEFNPNQKIKRELLYSFGHPADNKALAILRVRGSLPNRAQIAVTAKMLFLQGIPFDMKFDYSTDEKLYCSEFVAKCIVQSIQDSSWLHFTQTGGLKFVAVDNLLLASIMHPPQAWKY